MTDLVDRSCDAALAPARESLVPGVAAVCPGTVHHARQRPAVHRFQRPVTMVWFDPDRPEDLFGQHPLWSSRRPAPVRFRPVDYGVEGSGDSLALQARRDVAPVVAEAPVGPVRMLTQPRSYGWLFNPLTLYFVWGADATSDPIGVVAEVTNTPWKERHRYAVPFGPALGNSFEKVMHVSPFLGTGMEYVLNVVAEGARLRVAVDVVESEPVSDPDVPTDIPPVLRTLLDLERQPATGRVLSTAMIRHPFPTHRVSGAIHVEAARLWRKGVPFVAHPRRPATPSRAGCSEPVASDRASDARCPA